jgi:hypothetical protein
LISFLIAVPRPSALLSSEKGGLEKQELLIYVMHHFM